MEGTCPHCHKTIDLLEPKDLDALGLRANIRGPAIKKGRLPVWLSLRGDKLFLFLKKDVDEELERRRHSQLEKLVKGTNLARSAQEEARIIKALEAALETNGAPSTPRPTKR